MMEINQVIRDLEAEWDLEHGFFGHLRGGHFDSASFTRLMAILERIDLSDDLTVNRRLVSLLWYMPAFVEWQRKRVQHAGADPGEVDRAANCLLSAMERILGVP